MKRKPGYRLRIKHSSRPVHEELVMAIKRQPAENMIPRSKNINWRRVTLPLEIPDGVAIGSDYLNWKLSQREVAN